MNNVRVIAAVRAAAEESPCSHSAEMPVVIAPGETISQGSILMLTAGKTPKSSWIWCEYFESATVTELYQK